MAFFHGRLQARHVGVFHVNDVYGMSYFKAVKEIARKWDPSITVRGATCCFWWVVVWVAAAAGTCYCWYQWQHWLLLTEVSMLRGARTALM